MADTIEDNMIDYENHLVQYNRLLAAARSKHDQLETARDEAKIEYERDRERFVDVLSECKLLVAQRKASIDECENLKSELTTQVVSYRNNCNAMYENRCLQYEKALDNLESTKTLFKSKYEGALVKNRKKIALLDEIILISDNIKDRKV